MQAYRSFILNAPEYVNGFFAFLTIPPSPMFPEHLHLKKVCGVMWVSTGPAARAEAATKQMRSVGKPLLDHQAEMPLPAVNSLFDGLYPPGLQWYWRADFVKELSDDAIRRHAEHVREPENDTARTPQARGLLGIGSGQRIAESVEPCGRWPTHYIDVGFEQHRNPVKRRPLS